MNNKAKKAKKKEHNRLIHNLEDEAKRLEESEAYQELVTCKLCGEPTVIHTQDEIHVCMPCFRRHYEPR